MSDQRAVFLFLVALACTRTAQAFEAAECASRVADLERHMAP